MSFKYKPNKIKYLSCVNTLDEIHRYHATFFASNKKNVSQKHDELMYLEEELNRCSKNITDEDIHKKSLIREKINRIKEEIIDTENDVTELDYYSKTNPILTEYYKIMDENNEFDDMNSINEDEDAPKNVEILISDKLSKLHTQSQGKRKVKKTTHKRNKQTTESVNILNYFTKTVGEIQTSIATTCVSNRANLYDEYLTLIDSAYASNKIKSIPLKICEGCNIEKTLIQAEGLYVCKKCATVEHVVIESEIPNHKDTMNEKPKFPYKRQNHLIEWLNQFQAKESIDIPEEDIDKIKDEIKKQKMDVSIKTAPYSKVRSITKGVLKKLRMQKWYEHIQFIMSKITGKTPPVITREVEEKIKFMFKQCQEPFAKYCPADRTNFLNYSYVMHKLFKNLNMAQFVECCPLLKSREKLKIQDKIWKNICHDLGWKFYPSL